MKTSLAFIISYVLILGYYSSASNSSLSTADTASSITTISTLPTTAPAETTVQSSDSSISSSTSTTGSDASTSITEFVVSNAQTAGKDQAGTGDTTKATTASPNGPWRVVTYALGAVSGVLLLAFLASVIILFKMRSKLRQASKTLYPITPGPDDHEYLDLEEGIKKKNKKGVKVELKQITQNHEEEEFDSPTFPPTPPAKPQRSFKHQPPLPPSNRPTDKSSEDAPQLPVRGKNKWSQPKPSKENIQGKAAGGGEGKVVGTNQDKPNPKKGQNNIAFKGDEAPIRHGDLDDDLYEPYEHGNNNGLINETEDDDIDIQAYEEPIKSSQRASEQAIQRQGSSTGLPDLAIRKIPSREEIQDTPLQLEEEETFDTVDFGTVDPDSGLPDIAGMQNMDDLQFFDDPDAMTESVNEHNENTVVFGEPQDTEGEHHHAPSPTIDSLDDLLTYDDADMAIADYDDNADDEPGLYDDFEASNEHQMQFNVHSAYNSKDSSRNGDMITSETYKNENDAENYQIKTTADEKIDTHENELPKVPPRRKSTIDKNKGSAEQPILSTVTSRSNSTSIESADILNQNALPSVPPRRKSTFDDQRGSITQDLSTTGSSSVNNTTNERDDALNQPVLPSIPHNKDLLRNVSESESDGEVGMFDETVLAGERPPEIHWDTFPTDEKSTDIVQLRPGKKVGQQGQERPRDSYFLDMTETTVELSEDHTSTILADNITGIPGLNNLSE